MWIVLAVIVVGGAWYVFSMKSDGTSAPQDQTGTSADTTGTTGSSQAGDTATPTGKGSGSLTSIYSRGGNYTCTFETIGSGVKSTGTVYVAGGKTRADISTSAVGVTTVVHTIRSGSTSYTWVNGQSIGYKTAITATPTHPANSTGAGVTGDNTSQVNWDCHAWLPDMTQFAVPSSITFIAQ